MRSILKYPRTHHIEGSRLQPGDEDLESVPVSQLAGRHVVIEEKLDGANSGISFDESGALLLQSRGHYLTGGAREKHFALFKTWATAHQAALRDVLGPRYVMYGEWLYAKHTVYYDALPHYFMEFDVLDTQEQRFLSTPERAELLRGLPVRSVPVLHSGHLKGTSELHDLVRRSLYKTASWREALASDAEEHVHLDRERTENETDPCDEAEGLYLKVEEERGVVARYKFIRASFLTAVIESESHWLSRPILPNRLAPGVDLFAETM